MPGKPKVIAFRDGELGMHCTSIANYKTEDF